MAAELAPRYSPADVESRIYEMWEAAGYFHAEADPSRTPYCIMIPPPNVTDRLHVGHALNNSLQDALVRFHRMQGRNTLWMPGTDHASIATQTIVEKRILAEEGKRRTDFARDDFIARVQAWKDDYEATILGQLKVMGCSCDWRRTRFTMDEVCTRAVREAFFRLFEDGLIYRGKRLVNWDPATQTVLADDEVEHEEVRGHFWYLRYPLVGPVEVEGVRIEHVTVATTRPETMLGDTAVAMNPRDPRAAALVGKKVRLPIVGREIPIIVDEHVVLPDPESDDEKARFSTGFLKVTPAHDLDDYAIGERHGLPMVNVMAPDGSISNKHGWNDADTPEARNLIGMDRFEARDAIVEWFGKEELLEDDREYVHQVGHSYRSHEPIEPYLSDQWYIAVKEPVPWLAAQFGDGLIEGTDVPLNSLAGLALTPLLDGRVKFTPERYAKTYQSWVENLRDWPISRQLWWGHQIPVWRFELNDIDTSHAMSVVDVDQPYINQYNRFKELLEEVARIAGIAGQYSIQIDLETFSIAYVCSRGPAADELLDRFARFLHSQRAGDSHRGNRVGFTLSGIPGCPSADKQANELSELVKSFERDDDVLDTWFSSALWPFSTLGWPEESPELRAFYPGNVLCTAREIITLWVSRMVMMGQYCMGDVPFSDVFIHAMIQDGEGRKMSKSLGNGIDPLDIIDSHGADAMRFTLAAMTTQTQDVRMPVEHVTLPDGRTVNSSPKFDIGRNFCNKLWNAGRLVAKSLEGRAVPEVHANRFAFEDRWILSRARATLEAVTEALETYRFNDAVQTLYDFTWHDFCDWYLEIVKPRLADDGDDGGHARVILHVAFNAVLGMLHPIMPFITEELWAHTGRAAQGRAPGPGEHLIVSPWPELAANLDAPAIEAEMTVVQDVIRAVRNIRSKLNIAPKLELALLVSSGDAAVRETVESNRSLIQHMTGACELAIGESLAKPPHSAAEVTAGCEVFVPLEGLIDVDAERARLDKKLAEARSKLGGVERKLSNGSFVSRAPADVVERERAKADDLRAQAEALERNLADLA